MNFDRLCFVVGRDGAAEEFADRVVGAVDLVVFFGEVLKEEGGEGGGCDVRGGEVEDVSDLWACIDVGLLSKLKRRVMCFCL